MVKGVNLGGFDLKGKFWGFLTVGVHFHRAVTSAAVGVPSPSFYRDSGY